MGRQGNRERGGSGACNGRAGQFALGGWGAQTPLQLKAALIMKLWSSADPHSAPLFLSGTLPADRFYVCTSVRACVSVCVCTRVCDYSVF